MLNLFRSRPFHDPALGELRRSRGAWRGSLALTDDDRVPLALCGNRTAPDPEAILLARAVPDAFSAWRTALETALFDHREPYAESFAAEGSGTDDEPAADITTPDQVWPHVRFEFVSITLPDGVPTTEFGLAVAWDEEHTLGARFQEGRLVELCGSVLPP